MSEIHAHTTLYVRDTMIDQQVPPLAQKGAVKWVRENLFSSWLNIILTVLSIAAIWYLVSHLTPWFLNSVWNAGSLTECREILAAHGLVGETSGACWGVIRDRWTQLMFGFYPPEFYWRSILALVLLFVALLPVLFPQQVSNRFYIFSAIYPFLMVWLLWGGAFWVPILTMAGFGAGYLAYRLAFPLGGAITATIAAILGTVLWWMIAMPLINDSLLRTIAQDRMESTRAERVLEQERLPAEIAAVEAAQATVSAEIAQTVTRKDDILRPILAEQMRRSTVPLLADLSGLFAGLSAQSSGEELASTLQQAKLMLTPFATERASESLSPPLTEIKTALNVTVTPENLADVQASIAPLQALIAETQVIAEADPMPEDQLIAAQADFHSIMGALTDMRESLTALGAEHFRLSEQKRAADGLVRNIDTLTQNLANLPELRATAEQARADLPESVALLEAVPSGNARSNYEAADLTALQAVVTAEQGLISADSAVRSTFNDVGRIGLQPVPSSSFGGFQLSLIIGITGIVMSLPLGILLALGRQSNLFIINKVSVGFIEIIRGVPLIVWLLTAQFLLNYFLPPGTTFDLVLRVIIMVTLFASAYIAEVVRGGLAALPHGQYEAANALGLDYWKSMRLIVLPQALKISIPGIVNTFIGLFKDTTLVLFIGLYDPLGLAGTIRASTDWNGIYWELFIFIGVLFFIFCFSMGRYSKYLENKLQRENR